MAKNKVIIFNVKKEFNIFHNIWEKQLLKKKQTKWDSSINIDRIMPRINDYSNMLYPIVIIYLYDEDRFLQGELNDLKGHNGYCDSFGGIYQPYNNNFLCGRIITYKPKKMIS